MDVLRAEIAKKRKLLEEQKLVDGKKKYFKRGELLEKERDEYVQKYLAKDVRVNPSSSATYQHSDAHNNLRDTTADIRNLPRSEVIRKLRERGEPILLFGESEIDACSRLRQFEITAPEINRGFRNDFQEAMDQVDQAYLDEMLVDQTSINKDKNKNDDIDLDENVSYESIQEEAATLGRGNKEHDMNVIEMLLKFLLKLWYEQSNAKSTEEKMRTKTKMLRATFTQTRVYLKPLLRKLKRHSIPDDILDSLTVITKNLLKRDYILASDAYLTMAIGNAPWPIGVTMVGIHARTGREKIFSKNVAHVMNDETQRKYIQGLKRLMTKCQEFYPTDPSRCVEYVSKKDLQNT